MHKHVRGYTEPEGDEPMVTIDRKYPPVPQDCAFWVGATAAAMANLGAERGIDNLWVATPDDLFTLHKISDTVARMADALGRIRRN